KSPVGAGAPSGDLVVPQQPPRRGVDSSPSQVVEGTFRRRIAGGRVPSPQFQASSVVSDRGSTARPMGRSRTFTPTTTAVPAAATAYNPAPDRAPTAAEHHSVAAVLRPRTLRPSRRITPAPRNPMPDTIWAATRVGSASPLPCRPPKPCADSSTNKVAPTATSALVR